jgi:hypothetical protein
VILEGLVTTLGPDGLLNIAPMGPRVEGPVLDRFLLRPYRSSTTYRNLRALGEGVFHVTDDVLLIARAVIGLEIEAPTRPADQVRGSILTGACRYAEFRVTALDDSDDRTSIAVDTVARGRLRDFFGFNRAKHAVLEAAILASRTALLPRDQIVAELDRLRPLVAKTGGPDEHTAFDLLTTYVLASRMPQAGSLGDTA